MIFIYRKLADFLGRTDNCVSWDNWYYTRDESPIGCQPINVLTYMGRRWLIEQRDYSCILINPQSLGGVFDIFTRKNLLAG